MRKFSLGQMLITPGAQDALNDAGQTPDFFLDRHIRGDWGQVCEDDRRANEEALQHEARLLSAYKTLRKVKIWIITEWDRSVTTILLPDEY